MFGAIGGVCPLRLGGSATNGWTAAQHARFCADLVAVNRTLPLASWTFTKSGSTITITDYQGRNGTGLAHAPDEVVSIGTGFTVFRWTGQSFPDPYDPHKLIPIRTRAIIATVSGSVARMATSDVHSITGPPQRVDAAVITWGHAGSSVDATASVRIWGEYGDSQRRAIGDYAGDPNKEDSKTEGAMPYAEAILRQISSDRGTAYTKQPGTYVDCENLALARFWSACGPRLAEKFRANCVPGRSDERLAYWERFLAVPKRLNEPKWRTRQKLAAHYRLTNGPTVNSVREALQELLGDAFVDMTWEMGADLDNPPTATYWPVINPGAPSLSLGGGTWSSSRCTLLVETRLPANMSQGDFLALMNVDFFVMLDRLLPAWATFNWFLNDESGGGFILGESSLGFTAFA